VIRVGHIIVTLYRRSYWDWQLFSCRKLRARTTVAASNTIARNQHLVRGTSPGVANPPRARLPLAVSTGFSIAAVSLITPSAQGSGLLTLDQALRLSTTLSSSFHKPA